MKNFILNSETVLNGDTIEGVQLAPVGDFDGVLRCGEKRKKIVQRLDAAVFARILNAWQAAGSPELLVDADHASCDDSGSTRAYAWACNLRADPELGLLADFKLTDIGRTAVESREYRFVSPVFECDKNGVPLKMTSVALTNRPNLPVSCVLNSKSAGNSNVEDIKEKTMDKILALLGLEPDAREDAVIKAVEALQRRVAEAEAAQLQNEAEAVADEHKDKIENRDAFVKLYTAHGKDVAMAFIATVRAPAKPQQTILNAKTTATPQVRNSVGDVRKEMASLPPAERAAFYAAHKADF